MRIRAFTGPSRLDERQSEWVAERVSTLHWADEIRTGASRGADTIAAQISMDRFPTALHVLYVPDGPHNVNFVKYLVRRGAVTIDCPHKAKRAAAYRARNEMMVHGASQLIAFLFSPKFYRSGEWMTVNIARDLGVQIVPFIVPQLVQAGSTPGSSTEE